MFIKFLKFFEKIILKKYKNNFEKNIKIILKKYKNNFEKNIKIILKFHCRWVTTKRRKFDNRFK